MRLPSLIPKFSVKNIIVRTGTRFKEYWVNIFNDYRGVVVDTVSESKQKPLKTLGVLSLLGLAAVAIRTNPDLAHFKNTFVEARGDLLMVSETIRNPLSEEHLTWLAELLCQDRLKRLSFGFGSFVWYTDYSADVCLVTASCPQVQPRWRDVPGRIIDVGIVGRWFGLQRAMTDYDVNPAEWEPEGGTGSK